MHRIQKGRKDKRFVQCVVLLSPMVHDLYIVNYFILDGTEAQ